MTEKENLKKQITDDLSAVLKEAKSMGCKEVTYFRHIPLQNVETVIQALEENQWYKTIGTVEELQALKEKNEPKEPDYEGDGCWGGRVVIDTWICPNCEKHYEVDYDDYDYCPNCGQHIDHSGLTEDD